MRLANLSWQNRSLFALRTCAGIVGLAICAQAASGLGGLSGAYLRGAAGATALSLGGAYSASPEYLTPWWNPAIGATEKKRNLSAGAGIRSLGRMDAFASFDFRIPPRVGMGLMILYRGDPFLNNLYDETENKLEKGGFTSFTGKIALSYLVTRNLSAGLNIGILYQKLPTDYDGDKLQYSSSSGIGSFDFALAYRLSDKWMFSAVIRDLGASLNWEINSGDYNPIIEDKPLPSFTAASRYEGSLASKPLVWTMDLKAYIVDGQWKKLSHPEAQVCGGWEWRRWDSFYLRAGIGDLALNGQIINNTKEYFTDFPFRLTTGFSLDLSRCYKGLKLNYGMSTDKVWAGIDQQMDLTLSF